MAATSLSTPRSLTSPAFQTLRSYKFPTTFLSFSRYAKSLTSRHFFRSASSPHRSRRRLTTTIRSEFSNGRRASASVRLRPVHGSAPAAEALEPLASPPILGLKFAVCELPFATISSDSTGGVGGTCVLRGCVPKKLLVYASKFSHEFEESGGFGWNYEAEPKHDWSTLIANKNAELQRLTGIYKNILSNAGVELIEGRGKVRLWTHTQWMWMERFTLRRNILISVGGRPFIPDIPGSEYAIDSDAALDLPSKPEKIAIVGGGYIAVEFAGIFNGLMSDVHVFIRQKKVLRGFDEEIRDFVGEQMSLRGIEFHSEETPQAITRAKTKYKGLEAVGVTMSKSGAIEVDEYSQTSVPSIWAVGDVTDRINLTPVALMEGGALAKTLFANEPTKPDYGCFFYCAQIYRHHLSVKSVLLKSRPLKATLSGLPDRVFMKLIVCAKTNKVIGLHVCGDDSPEIVQGFAVALKAGLTKADFDATIGIHPTAAEELVTMRTPTRKIRSNPSEGKADSDIKAATGV
ncbi:glutathione reductase chloroplastic [Phtheirospermum japonicum]|uniref:glutathione-disulfide reductase n=1 Tax=Phtheirospermum japonicum TaxID=374723 RepID=A0A830D8I0_9LAMI|nr:glutathione reductase chloroplastic [Phtheirospermum japonicum]